MKIKNTKGKNMRILLIIVCNYLNKYKQGHHPPSIRAKIGAEFFRNKI